MSTYALNKSLQFLEEKTDDSRLFLHIRTYFRITNLNAKYHIISITKLNDIEFFLVVRIAKSKKKCFQISSNLFKSDTKYSDKKCPSKSVWTKNNLWEGCQAGKSSDKIKEKCNRVVLIIEIKSFDFVEFVWADVQFYEKEKCKVKINETEPEEISISKNSKDKKSNQKHNDNLDKENEGIKFLKHFEGPDEEHTSYLFPYFSGDIALWQMFLK